MARRVGRPKATELKAHRLGCRHGVTIHRYHGITQEMHDWLEDEARPGRYCVVLYTWVYEGAFITPSDHSTVFFSDENLAFEFRMRWT